MTKANVLIVDDEVSFLNVLKKRLTKRGFNVETAVCGIDALDLIVEKSDQVEVVILDVKMPGMDGIETLREIKRKFPMIEVIMLTGHATVGSAIEGMKLGAFDYLMKPADFDQFPEKILEAIEKRRVQEKKIIEARIKDITSRRL